jgi:hypothetical protein
LPIGIEADRPFIPEHIRQGKKFLGAGQYLMGRVFTLQFIVKIKLPELNVIPEVIAFYNFPGHHVTPLIIARLCLTVTGQAVNSAYYLHRACGGGNQG